MQLNKKETVPVFISGCKATKCDYFNHLPTAHIERTAAKWLVIVQRRWSMSLDSSPCGRRACATGGSLPLYSDTAGVGPGEERW